MSDFTVELERETDGRWIGEVTDLPGWPDFVFAFHEHEEIGRACWRESRSTPASRPTTFDVQPVQSR